MQKEARAGEDQHKALDRGEDAQGDQEGQPHGCGACEQKVHHPVW